MKHILIILFLFAQLYANATKYYIDPGGDDVTGNGSAGSPWASLYKACGSVTTAGDTIYVNAGSYTESTQSVLAVGVNIQGAGKTLSIINSTITTANTATIYAGSESNTDGNQFITGIKMDGDSSAYSPISINNRNNVKIYDCEFVDFLRRGVGFYGDGQPPSVWCTDNEIYDCTFTNSAGCFGSGLQYGNIEIHAQNGIKIYSNTIVANGRAEGTNGIPIKFRDQGYNKNIRIYNNTLTAPTKYDANQWAFGIELWYGQGGDEIYNNTIWGEIDLVGFAAVDTTYSAKIYNNTIGNTAFSDYLEYGILLEKYATDVYIYNNNIKNVGGGIKFTESGDPPHYWRNIYIYYNIFENLGWNTDNFQTWGMINFDDEANTSTGYGLYVYNNVWEANEAMTTTRWAIQLSIADSFYNYFIKNNIFLNWDRACIYGAESDNIVDTLIVTNNIQYNNANSNNPVFYNSFSPTNYTYSDTIKSDPLFITGTYRLKSNSPGINAGVNVGLTTDYRGYGIKGLPDIGAYEFLPLRVKSRGKYIKDSNKYIIQY